MRAPPAPHWSLRADRVRDLPLAALAVQLGYRPDPGNPARWKLPGSVLSISGGKFFDHRRDRGGGGAIDLVMHVRRCRFQAAVEFLERHAGLPLPAPVPASPHIPDRRRALRLPPPADRLWLPVRDFLAAARGLDPALLERCRQDGILYADSRRNAVFVCRDRCQHPVGAELVGTRPAADGRTFKGMAPGSRKALGGFWLPVDTNDLDALLIAESAVDALSAVLLQAPTLPPDTLVASTAGVASALPHWLRAFHAPRILCAYDADPAGDQAAAALRRHTPHCSRLRPVGAKDWNDLLRRSPPT